MLAVELGYKGQFFDGKLQLNGAIYQYDYEDINVQVVVNTLIGANTSVTNAPEAENRGVEADFVYLLTDNITLGGSASYTDTEYTKELPTGGIIDDNDPFAPASLYSTDERTVPIKGTPLVRIPEYKFSLWGIYNIPLGDKGNVELITSYSWQDEVVWSQGASEGDTAPEFARLDFRANWTSPSEAWFASVFVNNVLDEIGIRSMNAEGEAQGYLRSATPTLPRAFGAEVRWRFGSR